MRITALEEYGLRCMISLAHCQGGESLTLPEISEKEGMSLSYAGKLLMILRQANLVQAERGRRGGYKLSRPAGRISLKEVFDALGEPMFSAGHCRRYSGDDGDCVHQRDCLVRDVWQTICRFVDNYLERIMLADIAFAETGGKKKENKAEDDLNP